MKRRFNRFIILMVIMSLGKVSFSQDMKTIHVFVALCDNENQGIVRVSDELGNGQDPAKNLYWGALYGVKTFFRNSSDWTIVRTYENPDSLILERVLFKHKTSDVYLLADAYDGIMIKQAITDFLKASGGDGEITVNNMAFGGTADLIAYLGHNGLMEFDIEELFKKINGKDVIILSCISKSFFAPYLKQTSAYPLLWATGLMAPEAYTLKAAIDGWMLGETDVEIANRAAEAYNAFQRCGLESAKRLLVTGW